MSASFSDSEGDDLDVDISLSNDVAKDGESQATIERDLHLHTQEPNCNALVIDNSNNNILGQEGKAGDIHHDFSPRQFNAQYPNEGTKGIPVTGNLDSPPEDASFIQRFVDEAQPPNTDIAAAIEGFVSRDDEPPPVPFSTVSHKFEDELKSKKYASKEALGNTEEECPPLPFCVDFAPKTNTEKASPVEFAQYASSIVQTPPPVSDPRNHDQALANQGIVQESRPIHSAVNLNDATTEGPFNHPRAVSNVLSQPGVLVDNFLLPEAFPVEANEPVQSTNVRVAELVEPDQNWLALKKNHACIVFSFLAALLLALGLAITFTSGKARSIEIASIPSSFSPSLQPTLFRQSPQPSLSIKNVIERNVLQRNLTFDDLEPTDGHVLALVWITDQDYVDTSDSKLFQRYVLGLLAVEFSISSWLSEINECSWAGVQCDVDGHVIELDLSDYGLDGTIPPEIGTLQHLQNLSLSDNSFSGTLPSEIGNLEVLSKFSLDNNNFMGTLPSEIGKLKKLTELNLGMNEFTGTLPLAFGNSSSLTHLNLESNLLTGSLPLELGNLTELIVLILSNNMLTGTLPSDLGNLAKLAELSLDHNNFNGTIPSEFGNLSNLTRLILWQNQIAGALPSEMGNLKMLNILNVDENSLSSTLPSALGDLVELATLYLHTNQFTGTLPSELGNLKNLTMFGASQNQFNGTLPTAMGNWKELWYARFNENQFTGTLPTELGNLKVLEYLYVFSNKFSGTIPSVLQNLTSMKHLSMYSNQFVGTLPSWIGNLDKLSMLYLGGNSFTGTLPFELGQLSELTYFGIDSNKFTGTLPSWIGNLRNLTLLWLNDNQFTGTFPSEIENNLVLEDFCLGNNNFTGSIPADIEDNWNCNY